MASSLSVEQARYGNVTVLTPVGRIDQETAAEFQTRLMEEIGATAGEAGHVALDLGGIQFISSLGLRSLMIGAKEMRGADRRFVVANLSPLVREVFQISRFDRVIDVHDTLRGAVVAISADAATAYDGARP